MKQFLKISKQYTELKESIIDNTKQDENQTDSFVEDQNTSDDEN